MALATKWVRGELADVLDEFTESMEEESWIPRREREMTEAQDMDEEDTGEIADEEEEDSPSEVYEKQAVSSISEAEDASEGSPEHGAALMIQHAQVWAILSLVAAVRELGDIVAALVEDDE